MVQAMCAHTMEHKNNSIKGIIVSKASRVESQNLMDLFADLSSLSSASGVFLPESPLPGGTQRHRLLQSPSARISPAHPIGKEQPKYCTCIATIAGNFGQDFSFTCQL